MKTHTITTYDFNELDDNIKELVIDRYRNDMAHRYYEHELDEGYASIENFCQHFGVTVKECCMSPFNRAYIITDATPAHFRGFKLKSINPDYCPTGYYIDSYLWPTFVKEMQNNDGNAFDAFKTALYDAIHAVQRECESYYEDEHIIDTIQANEYQFLQDGTIFN